MSRAMAVSPQADCYEPSSLINWVHEEVPFIDIGFNNTAQDAEDLIDNLSEGVDHYYDYFLVRSYQPM